MNFVIILLIPVVITGLAFVFLHTVTWKEALVQFVGCLAVLGISWQVAKWSGLSDTEILNGRITAKVAGTQSCCHCTTICTGRDSKGNCTSTTTICSHSYDHYWSLASTVGTFGIRSCSGSSSPPEAWVRAYVGEPASTTNSYQNYLKADPESLFVKHTGGRYEDRVPPYPEPFAHYKIEHVITDGVAIPPSLQQGIRDVNAELGTFYQVDLTVLLTTVQDPLYAQSVEKKWLFGPKNAFIVVAGVRDGVITWVRGVSFSKVEAMKVMVRDELQGKRLDDPAVVWVVDQAARKYFKRTSMSEFEYLARSAEPRGAGVYVTVILQLLMSIGLSVLMHKNDLFNEERKLQWHY